MVDNIDKLLEELTSNLTSTYGKGKYIPLKDLADIAIARFSNVTIGKDKVDYQLVTTNDITKEGRIVLHDPKKSLRHIGAIKGVKKYQIKKGDIIFPQKKSFRTIGVMVEDTKIAYVGYHGLMRISCGADKLDFAFFLKDYLSLGPIGDFIAKNISNPTKLIDILEILPIPTWTQTNIAGYSDTSLNVKYAEQELSLLLSKIKLLSEKNHTYLDHRNEITKGSDKILKTLKTMQKQVDSLLDRK